MLLVIRVREFMDFFATVSDAECSNMQQQELPQNRIKKNVSNSGEKQCENSAGVENRHAGSLEGLNSASEAGNRFDKCRNGHFTLDKRRRNL